MFNELQRRHRWIRKVLWATAGALVALSLWLSWQVVTVWERRDWLDQWQGTCDVHFDDDPDLEDIANWQTLATRRLGKGDPSVGKGTSAFRAALGDRSVFVIEFPRTHDPLDLERAKRRFPEALVYARSVD